MVIFNLVYLIYRFLEWLDFGIENNEHHLMTLAIGFLSGFLWLNIKSYYNHDWQGDSGTYLFIGIWIVVYAYYRIGWRFFKRVDKAKNTNMKLYNYIAYAYYAISIILFIYTR